MKIVCFILCLFLVSSCVRESDYEVNTSLEPYLNTFVEEAQKRGFDYSPMVEGLVMEFADLEDSKAGICYHENPLRIEIDQEYWNNLAGYANEQDLKKELIYHELGHGLIDRRHENSLFPNSEWRSIMCGGDVGVENRSWNINFRSIRQQYYLDELFLVEGSELPYWVSPSFEPKTGFSEADQTINTISSHVYVGHGNSYEWEGSCVDEKYTVKNNSVDKRFAFAFQNIEVSNKQDFYYEVKIHGVSIPKQTNKVGIYFGKSIGATLQNYHYFLLDCRGIAYIGNNVSYGWYTDLQTDVYALNSVTFGIRKKDKKLYYYLNGKCVYCDEMTVDLGGDLFGFQLPPGCMINVSDLKIYGSSEYNNRLAKVIEPIEVDDSMICPKWTK